MTRKRRFLPTAVRGIGMESRQVSRYTVWLRPVGKKLGWRWQAESVNSEIERRPGAALPGEPVPRDELPDPIRRVAIAASTSPPVSPAIGGWHASDA